MLPLLLTKMVFLPIVLPHFPPRRTITFVISSFTFVILISRFEETLLGRAPSAAFAIALPFNRAFLIVGLYFRLGHTLIGEVMSETERARRLRRHEERLGELGRYL